MTNKKGNLDGIEAAHRAAEMEAYAIFYEEVYHRLLPNEPMIGAVSTAVESVTELDLSMENLYPLLPGQQDLS